MRETAEQPGRLLVGLRGGTLLLTDDAGDSWSRLEAKLPGSSTSRSPAASSRLLTESSAGG